MDAAGMDARPSAARTPGGKAGADAALSGGQRPRRTWRPPTGPGHGGPEKDCGRTMRPTAPRTTGVTNG